MNKLIETLVAGLQARRITYVQWKSNYNLPFFLQGGGDLDLLIDPLEITDFENILAELSFIEARTCFRSASNEIKHFFGLDLTSGKFIHVHAYYRLITGGTLFKNLELPAHCLMHQTRTHDSGINLPLPGLEYQMFLIRKLSEFANLIELPFVIREKPSLNEEFAYLEKAVEQSNELVPEASLLTPDALRDAQSVARNHFPILRSFRVGLRLANSLAPYRRETLLLASVSRIFELIRRVLCKIALRGKGTKVIVPRGKVIAVTGTDGS